VAPGPDSIHQVRVADGRLLMVETSGAPDGTPVFLLHGTPGSRSGPRPRSSMLYRLGVRLITYDRPGYGHSTRREERYVADAAADVAAIATALGLGRFAVVGRSGGGPHALACAALLGDRVVRTAVLVPIAPVDATGLNWDQGMVDDNVDNYKTADADVASLAELLVSRAEEVARDPEFLTRLLQEQMTPSDKRIVADPALRRLLAETYTEAVRTGPYGWIDDVLAFRKTWGFSLDDIRSPVLLWHGEEDNFSPVSHTHWLATRIPHAQVRVQPDSAHFAAFEILPTILSWLVAPPRLAA
jgi:pimeloyl-ACP methyl ester carboxylesterase